MALAKYNPAAARRSCNNAQPSAGQTKPWLEGLSPEPVAHLSQNRLLPLLLQRSMGESLDSSSSSSSSSSGEKPGSLGEVLWGRAVTNVSSSSDSSSSSGLEVTATTKDGGTEQLRCQYLVAADGANSSIRYETPTGGGVGEAACLYVGASRTHPSPSCPPHTTKHSSPETKH